MDDIGLKMLSMGRPIIHTALEHYTKVWGDQMGLEPLYIRLLPVNYSKLFVLVG